MHKSNSERLFTSLLEFVATSTYFQFKGKLYRQKERFAMGDPPSAITSGFLMEDLESKTIATKPDHFGLNFWKRYVDEILEKGKIRHTQALMDHLNSIDDTQNIKYMHKEGTNRSVAFLGMKIQHRDDGSIKI